MSEIIIIGGFNDQPVEVLLEQRDPVHVISEIGQGIPGISAYQVAVKNGFVGTEQEWLDSITGFAIAKQAGFEGTIEDWIDLLGSGTENAVAAGQAAAAAIQARDISEQYRDQSLVAQNAAEQARIDAGLFEASAASHEQSALLSSQIAESARDDAQSARSEALLSASEAASSLSEAVGYRDQAQNSATSASLSAQEAELSRIAAASSEAIATAKADDAASSQLAAQQAEINAGASAGFADQRATDAEAAASSASEDAVIAVAAAGQAEGSASDANNASAAALLASNEAKEARDEAVTAAENVVGAIVDRGSIDMSAGAYPAKPATSSVWRVSTPGAVEGLAYSVGDQLVYSLDLDLFYKQDSTAAREWTESTVTQVEAEGGTSTARRAWTAMRVWQAIYAWWLSVSSAWGRGFVASANAAAGRTALELGTAATHDVTTSATDTTANRVTKVGDFGPGSTNVPSVLDLRASIPSGLYQTGNGYTGSPGAGFSSFGDGVIRLERSNGAARYQLFMHRSQALARLIYSVKRSDITDWIDTEIYHQLTSVGTVSQSGGVPTGALIEYGVNSNGQYWRFAGGLQICIHRINMGPLDTGAGTFEDPRRHTNFQSWTFPAAFAAIPRFTPSAYPVATSPVNARWLSVGYNDVTTTQAAVIRAQRNNGDLSSADILVDLIAIGPWHT